MQQQQECHSSRIIRVERLIICALQQQQCPIITLIAAFQGKHGPGKAVRCIEPNHLFHHKTCEAWIAGEKCSTLVVLLCERAAVEADGDVVQGAQLRLPPPLQPLSHLVARAHALLQVNIPCGRVCDGVLGQPPQRDGAVHQMPQPPQRCNVGRAAHHIWVQHLWYEAAPRHHPLCLANLCMQAPQCVSSNTHFACQPWSTHRQHVFRRGHTVPVLHNRQQ